MLDQVGCETHHRHARFPDRAAGDFGGEFPVSVVVATRCSPVEGNLVSTHRLGDSIGLGERSGKSLLRVDRFHAVLGAENDRVRPLQRRRRDTDDIGLFLQDHFPVIEIGVGDAEPLRKAFQALLAPVGDRHDLGIVDVGVGRKVTIRLARTADRDFVFDQSAHPAGADDRDLVFR